MWPVTCFQSLSMWPNRKKKNLNWKHISFCLSVSLWLTHPPVQSHYFFSFGSAARRQWDFAPGSCWVWLQVIVLVKPVLLEAAETALDRGALSHTYTHKGRPQGFPLSICHSSLHHLITSPSHPSVHRPVQSWMCEQLLLSCSEPATRPPTNWPQPEISTEIETIAAAWLQHDPFTTTAHRHLSDGPVRWRGLDICCCDLLLKSFAVVAHYWNTVKVSF